MSDRRVILINDLPYAITTTDPLDALETTIACSSDDWAYSRAMAWVYGIVIGWSFDGDDDDPDDYSPTLREEFRVKFGWTGEQIARLTALHEAFAALAEEKK